MLVQEAQESRIAEIKVGEIVRETRSNVGCSLNMGGARQSFDGNGVCDHG